MTNPKHQPVEAENSKEFTTVEGLGDTQVFVVVLDLRNGDKVVFERAIGWSVGQTPGFITVETETRRVHWYPVDEVARIEVPLRIAPKTED